MFDSAKFNISINIERISRFPYTSGMLLVRWNAGDSPRPNTHGHTRKEEVLLTEANFNYHTKFQKRIGLRSSSRLLRSCNCRFDVIWEPIGGKEVNVGTLNIDLSQFAEIRPKKRRLSIHKKHMDEYVPKDEAEVCNKSISYLLKSQTNSLLTVKINLEYLSGNEDYEIPEFTAPAIQGPQLNFDSSTFSMDREAKISKGVNDLRDTVADCLLKSGTNSQMQDTRWYDLDNLLTGKNTRLIPQSVFEDFREKGIELPSYDEEDHELGTPYTETEIRESFVSWKIT